MFENIVKQSKLDARCRADLLRLHVTTVTPQSHSLGSSGGNSAKQRSMEQSWSGKEGEMSGKQRDFLYRYVEAASGVERVPRDPLPTPMFDAAKQSYAEAFKSYAGRAPSDEEMDEVYRINFGVDSEGRIGVVQKTHSAHPHTHATSRARRVVACNNQVSQSQLPPVRGARDRFPGTIPVWSSTKQQYTLISRDSYADEHRAVPRGTQNAASLK